MDEGCVSEEGEDGEVGRGEVDGGGLDDGYGAALEMLDHVSAWFEVCFFVGRVG